MDLGPGGKEEWGGVGRPGSVEGDGRDGEGGVRWRYSQDAIGFGKGAGDVLVCKYRTCTCMYSRTVP